jgi:hypothetical protein
MGSRPYLSVISAFTSVISTVAALLAIYLAFVQIDKSNEALLQTERQITISNQVSRAEARLTVLQYEAETLREIFWIINDRFPTSWLSEVIERIKRKDPSVNEYMQEKFHSSLTMVDAYNLSAGLFSKESGQILSNQNTQLEAADKEARESRKSTENGLADPGLVLKYLQALDRFVTTFKERVQVELSERHKELAAIRETVKNTELPKSANNFDLMKRVVTLVASVDSELALGPANNTARND